MIHLHNGRGGPLLCVVTLILPRFDVCTHEYWSLASPFHEAFMYYHAIGLMA